MLRPNAKLGWKLRENVELPYSSDMAFQGAVQAQVAKREQAFRATVAELVKKGWMTEAEAANTVPKLEIAIHDARADKTAELPGVPLMWTRVSVIPAIPDAKR